jgi:hypothetical protein
MGEGMRILTLILAGVIAGPIFAVIVYALTRVIALAWFKTNYEYRQKAMRAHRPTTYEEWLANLSPKERESYESRMREHNEWLANLSLEDREVYDAEDLK